VNGREFRAFHDLLAVGFLNELIWDPRGVGGFKRTEVRLFKFRFEIWRVKSVERGCRHKHKTYVKKESTLVDLKTSFMLNTRES